MKGTNDKQRELTALDRQGTQQQRPDLSAVTLTWHAGKYSVHKLHQREVLNEGKDFRIIIVITTRHACWRIEQQRSSSTHVCHWPASGWCPGCGSCSSFPFPQFFARLPSVDHASAFPSGVQWIATLVMELASLRSTCPIQRHRLPLMMVSISSCWHRAKRSRFEMVLGQKMRWIFLRLVA